MNEVARETGRVPGLEPGHLGSLLVLGYGNEMRGDDGVGPAVAEAVAALGLTGVRVETCHQLTPEWAGVLEGEEGVVFVDAVEAKGDGRVVVWEVEPAIAERTGWSGHRMTPEAMMTLTRELYGRCPRAWCIGIPVRTLGWGPGLSEQARAGVVAGVQAIREVWSLCMKRAS